MAALVALALTSSILFFARVLFLAARLPFAFGQRSEIDLGHCFPATSNKCGSKIPRYQFKNRSPRDYTQSLHICYDCRYNTSAGPACVWHFLGEASKESIQYMAEMAFILALINNNIIISLEATIEARS